MLLKKFTLLAVILILCVPTVVGQVEDDPDGALEEEKNYEHITYSRKKGFMYGLNVGLLMANKEPASFYNGTAPNDISIFLNNSNVITQISEFIGGYTFQLVELPQDLRYRPAVSFGINFRYQLDYQNAFVADVNYTKLTSEGQIVLETSQVDPNTANPFLEFFNIWGKEDRMVTSFGYQYNFNKPAASGTFIEFGPLFTTVKVRQNAFRVGDRTYNILRPQTVNGGQFINNRQQSVTDIGFYSALGFNFEFDKFTVDAVFRASFEKVQFEDDVEAKHNLHYYPNLRFAYRIIK